MSVCESACAKKLSDAEHAHTLLAVHDYLPVSEPRRKFFGCRCQSPTRVPKKFRTPSDKKKGGTPCRDTPCRDTPCHERLPKHAADGKCGVENRHEKPLSSCHALRAFDVGSGMLARHVSESYRNWSISCVTLNRRSDSSSRSLHTSDLPFITSHRTVLLLPSPRAEPRRQSYLLYIEPRRQILPSHISGASRRTAPPAPPSHTRRRQRFRFLAPKPFTTSHRIAHHF